MDFKQIIYSAIAYTVLAEIVNTVESVFLIGYYMNPAYFSLWSKIMMPTHGPPTATFYLVSILFTLISGVIFAWFYSLVKSLIPGKDVRKGLNYGLLLFLVAGVPFTLTIYLILAVPTMLLLGWAIGSLVVYLLSGISFSKIIR